MKALIFDYDGLIVDSETPEFLSWKAVYQAAGTDLSEQIWTSAVGAVDAFRPREYLEKTTGRSFSWDAIDAARRQKLATQQQAQPVLPGIARLMKRGAEAGFRIGVASNSTADWVESGLQRLGLRHLVETVRTVESVKRPKPFPDVYLRVLADLGAEAAQSFAFEDSQPGVDAAKAAGLTVVAVPHWLTKYHDLSRADRVVDSLENFALPEFGN